MDKLTVKQLKEKINELDNPYLLARLKKAELQEYYSALLFEDVKGVDRKSFEDMKNIPANITPIYYEGNDWLKHLHDEGWATVPIMNEEISGYFANEFLSWLECLTPYFDRNDSSTWSSIPPNFNGIFRNYISHLEWVWQIRELCFPIFRQIWRTDDLLCSFDSGCFLPPKARYKINKDGTYSTKHWMHCDQPRDYRGFNCVQGIVNLLPNGPHDGGLTLIEGSKDIFSEYLDKHVSEGRHCFHIDLNDPLIKGKRILKICAPAGHILLWDSRMFHCNIDPRFNASPRLCTYVSMQPRSLASEDQISQRIELYNEGRGTAHWVGGKWFSARSKEAWNFGKEIIRPEKIEIAKLNSLRRRLIGLRTVKT